MAVTHFTGPVASANGFNTSISGATATVDGTDLRNTVKERSIQVSLSNAQVLALFTTPVEVIPAPGANASILLESVIVYKPASAAATIGSATNLTLGYAGGTALTGTQAVTGFLDQTTAQTRLMYQAITSITPTANTGITIRLAGADVTSIDSGIIVLVNYVIFPTVLA